MGKLASPLAFPLGGEPTGLGPGGFSYWGPLFPDYRGARYVKDAVRAELAIGPLIPVDDPLSFAVIRANDGGTAGNTISVHFINGAMDDDGEISEDLVTREIEVKFNPDLTTMSDIAELFDTITLATFVGTWNPDDALTIDDEFIGSLSGGLDPIETQVTFWGPHFPDSNPFDTDIIPGIGPDGAATFALPLEKGTSVAFAWSTEIHKFYDGRERRTANLVDPIQTYRGGAFLLAEDTRVTRSRLAQYASAGSVFLLGLPWEELTLSADADATSVPVFGISECDWANPGQRVLILASDGAYIQDLVVQSVAADELVVHPSVDSTIARYGSRIMPAMAVYLDAQQGFSRYPHPTEGVEQWTVVARAAIFGFSSAGAQASLELAPLTARAILELETPSGILNGVVLRARDYGGDPITVSITDDSLLVEGQLYENTITRTSNIRIAPLTTTAGQMATLVASSALIEMIGTWNPSDILTTVDVLEPTQLIEQTSLDGAVIRARQPGTTGNIISVEFIPDAADAAGDIFEEAIYGINPGEVIAYHVHVHFKPDETTMSQIETLLNSGTLTRLDGTWTGGDVLPVHASFDLAALTGGDGESVVTPGRGATLERFGGVEGVEGVHATLELGPITGGDNALQGAVLTSRASGGNLILVAFVASEDAPNGGQLEEDEIYGFDGSLIAQLLLVQFHQEVTTAEQITVLINNFSTFVTMGGPMAGGVLQEIEDEFIFTALSGGVVAVAEVLGRPIWDRGVDVDGSAPDSMQSMVRLVELGGVPTSFGTASEPDWGRHVSLTSSDKSEWQWLKLFLHTVYGAQKSFYLPTWRPDLIAEGAGPTGGGTATGTLTIQSSVGDLGFWFPAKRQVLQIVHDDGRVSFVLVTEAEDNEDGTTTLQISANPGDSDAVLPESGVIELLSWLELCRFEDDTFEVSWSGATFSMTTVARAVQQ